MKKILSIILFFATLSAWSQHVDYSDHHGRVVDATTGKPLPNVKVSHAIGGQTDAKGHFTVRYYSTDNDRRVIFSHPGYCSDTFSFAPTFVSLRRTTSSSQKNRPKVAVVLSGGGAKGVAHISALKVIEEAGFPIDIICGTSMGSLIGALYSIGYTPDFLDSLVRNQDWTALLSDRSDPGSLTLHQREEQNTYVIIRNFSREQPQRGGIIRGHNLQLLFQQLCRSYLDSISFDSLPIRFACVGTDIVRGNEVDFRSGHLISAIRASMAIPGVFTPVRMDDMVIVDGGLQNNYPADLARAMGADIVIGVSVQDDLASPDEIDNVGDVMSQIISRNSHNKFNENVHLSDIFIRVIVKGYSAASFSENAVDSLLLRGQKAARKLWPQLISLRQRNNIDSVVYPLPFQHAALPPDDDFNRPSPALSIPKHPIGAIGFRFDSEEMGAIQLCGKLPFPTKTPIALSGTVRLGRRSFALAELSMLTPIPSLNPTLALSLRNIDLDYYSASQRTFNTRYLHSSLLFNPIDFKLRLFTIRAGIRADHYNYYARLLSSDSSTPVADDGLYISYYSSTDLNTENDWYFPSRGSRYHFAFFFHTTDFYSFLHDQPIIDITAHWRTNIHLSSSLSLQPMLYSRLLFGSAPPLAFRNVVGGNDFALYTEQQLPLPGIGHIQLVDRRFAALQIQLQLRLNSAHYLHFLAVGAYHCDHFRTFLPDHLIGAIQASYAYNSIAGPLGARLGYSTLSNSPYLFLYLGHTF